jgi:two-component system chemotaxis sensor kinase CheA
LTLAMAETFIISAAGQTCAIPQSFVTEILQVESSDFKKIRGVTVVPYKSGVLPIIRLAEMFQLSSPPKSRLHMLVLSSERGSVGLIVEKVHGQKEVVVRAIRDPLIQVPGIAGATELGDGRPVLILDGTILTSGVVRPHEQTDGSSSQFRFSAT